MIFACGACRLGHDAEVTSGERTEGRGRDRVTPVPVCREARGHRKLPTEKPARCTAERRPSGEGDARPAFEQRPKASPAYAHAGAMANPPPMGPSPLRVAIVDRRTRTGPSCKAMRALARLRDATDAIADDVALSRFGAVLGGLHALTAVAWFRVKNVAALVTSDDVVCWPMFPGCANVRTALTPGLVRQLVAIYAGLAVAASVTFLRRRPRAALVTLVAACLFGAFVHALDFRMRLNQTYMLAWVTLVFVLAREKRRALAFLIVAFYVAAGLLKTNREWLSGAALYARPWLVPESLLPASCAWVLVLELVVVLGLLAPWRTLRLFALVQLGLFHLVSWRVVGWYYPVLMAGLLSFYVLTEDAPVTLDVRKDLRWPPGSAAIVVFLFGAFQLIPACYRGDAALTGEGRLFALHMFDARVTCTGGAVVHAPWGEERTYPLVAEASDVRSKCDPIVILAHAKYLCHAPWARASGVRVDVRIDAKRASDVAPRPLVRLDDVCTNAPDYTVLHENPWIVAREARR